jgi:hypothetical protein
MTGELLPMTLQFRSILGGSLEAHPNINRDLTPVTYPKTSNLHS